MALIQFKRVRQKQKVKAIHVAYIWVWLIWRPCYHLFTMLQNPSSTQKNAFSGIQCLSNLKDTLYDKALFSERITGPSALGTPGVVV